MAEARKIAEDHGGQISTSYLQRRLQIGYPRAARLKELLDEEFEKENKEGPPPPLPHDDNPPEPGQ
jgi:DNA segregation ATPase FtsK/SpoIIIE-like protein